MKSYRVKKAVKAELRLEGKVVRVSFKAGAVTPKNADEELALEHLVSLGLATTGAENPKAEAPAKKKGSTS